jgi:CAAX prenyl protease-like protein
MKNSLLERQPALPYILPFAIFMVFTGLTGYVPAGMAWVYPLKTVVVGILLIGFWRFYPEIRSKAPDARAPAEITGIASFLLAVVVGFVVFAIWILPDRLGVVIPSFSESSVFNPYNQFQSTGWIICWIGFRLFGSSVVVPVMEELFWRSFLIRYLIEPDFKRVPIGAFSWLSFGVTVLLFGVEHHRWLVGIIAGIIYNLLLYRTKSIFACILAHAITNLVLGIYVLVAHQWGYW